jgi:hypothetical protein
MDDQGVEAALAGVPEGEVFEIAATRKEPPEIAVLDVRPADR